VECKPELLDALLAAVSSDVARLKFPAAKALRSLSQRAPDLIYPHFDFFASFLRHENAILRWNAILILGNLATVDGERRVDRTTYATPECRNVAIGHAIDALDRLFPMIADKGAVQRFVTRLMDNPRAATRKRAERFLRKWPLAPSGVKDGAAPANRGRYNGRRW